MGTRRWASELDWIRVVNLSEVRMSQLINRIFLSPNTPSSILDIFYLQTVLQWTPEKSRPYKIGPNLVKLKTFNPSLALRTFTGVLFTIIPSSQCRWHAWLGKELCGTSPMPAGLPSRHLRRRSWPLRSLSNGSPDLHSLWKLTPLTALSTILSTISNSDNEVHPIAFHSWTFTSTELNYDIHDKEHLAIFEAFKCWWHYLEGSPTPVDVVTDHKNLKYFSTTKLLTRQQAHWSEYLSQFNLVIWFRPGKLSTKPDALTRRWDVYPKEEGGDYATINPHNLSPVFTNC